MNLHRDRYLSGAPFYVRTAYRPGGKQYAVFDRTVRWRAAAQSMRASGRSDCEISMALGRPRALIERVLAFGWRSLQ